MSWPDASGTSGPAGTPAAAGYRWPAEWEPHEATWLTWPHNPETWPGCLDEVEDAFEGMVRALAGRERVHVNVADAAAEERVRRRLADVQDQLRFFHVPSNDSWIRDNGPVFVVRGEAPQLAAIDFGFDAWGGKYPPWDLDERVAQRCIEALGLPRFEAPFVLEAGSVDGDGEGTVLTTTACLLNANRRRAGEPPRTREAMEQRLADWLGARAVVWLEDGIVGDDTDGHVDDFARFVARGRVVCCVEPDPSDPNHAPLATARETLRAARDASGRPLEVIELPMPPPVVHRGERCPASYANFLLANGVALVPVFDAPSDEQALAVLRDCLPGREVVGVPARALVAGLGAVHCLSQQLPAVPAPPPA